MEALNLKQDDKVSFNNTIIKGTGIIMGIATNGDCLFGQTYIIKPDERISNEVYDFECCCMPELYLKRI